MVWMTVCPCAFLYQAWLSNLHKWSPCLRHADLLWVLAASWNGPGQLLASAVFCCLQCSPAWWHQLRQPAGAVRLAHSQHQQEQGIFASPFCWSPGMVFLIPACALSPVPSACLVAVTLQRDTGWVRTHVYSISLVRVTTCIFYQPCPAQYPWTLYTAE